MSPKGGAGSVVCGHSPPAERIDQRAGRVEGLVGRPQTELLGHDQHAQVHLQKLAREQQAAQAAHGAGDVGVEFGVAGAPHRDAVQALPLKQLLLDLLALLVRPA